MAGAEGRLRPIRGVIGGVAVGIVGAKLDRTAAKTEGSIVPDHPPELGPPELGRRMRMPRAPWAAREEAVEIMAEMVADRA